MLPFDVAAQFQALLILMLFMAPTFDVVDALMPKIARSDRARPFQRAGARCRVRHRAGGAARSCSSPHSAWLMGDAIVRTLYRLHVSRRNLLEWRTASQAQQGRRQHARRLLPHDVRRGGDRRSPASPSRSPAGSTGACVAADLRAVLDRLAGLRLAGQPLGRDRGPADRRRGGQGQAARHRAPDLALFRDLRHGRAQHAAAGQFPGNAASPVVAARTSPTNIGIYLLSVISARDFGWISLANAVERLEADDRHDREDGDAIAAISTTGTTPRR